MNEIEITEIPPIPPGERSLVDFHSLVNVLNVLMGELIILGLTIYNDDRYFCEGMAVGQSMLESVRDRDAALRIAHQLDAYERTVFDEIKAKVPEPLSQSQETQEVCANLRAVFAIFKVRARELLARSMTPEAWETFDVDELRSNFTEVFEAMERVSKGRYRILYNAACQGKGDYYVDFKVEAKEGRKILMPPVLQDVMRDLIANARKYTAPGGTITAAFHEDERRIRFVVRDTGRGIPAGEIREVPAFGKRASNVTDVRTLGGGFGLTKAFLVTKQFGGRFWIASELGRGTQVRVEIPRPAV